MENKKLLCYVSVTDIILSQSMKLKFITVLTKVSDQMLKCLDIVKYMVRHYYIVCKSQLHFFDK